jgi:hypothetical protein
MSEASKRIGNAEREAAVAALKQHRLDGRLDPQEYEDRSVRAQQARTWDEVAALFTDLPDPHLVPSPTTLRDEGKSANIEQVVQPAERRGLVPQPWAGWAMAFTPLAALLLFYTTGFWLWWLAIPIAGLIIYGPDGRHAERDRWREQERVARRHNI